MTFPCMHMHDAYVFICINVCTTHVHACMICVYTYVWYVYIRIFLGLKACEEELCINLLRGD
jgi:hypothetical protein